MKRHQSSRRGSKSHEPDALPVLFRFVSYLRPYVRIMSVIFVLLLAVTAFDLARPYLIGRIVDEATRERTWGLLILPLTLFALTIFGRGFTLMARNYLIQRTGMRVTCDMRIRIFDHLQKLSLRFYDERHTGKIVSRITNDTGLMHNLVTGASVNMIGDIITILGVLILLLHANWQLALITYAVLPMVLANFLWHRRRLRVESRVHRRNWDKVMSFLHERISSTRLVKAFAAEYEETENFREGVEADFIHYNQVVWRNTLLSVGADMFSGLGTLVVLGYGAYLVINKVHGFTIGQLIAFNFYLGLLYTPLTRIVDANVVIQQAVTGLEKIFAVLDTQPHVPDNDSLPALPPVRGRVEFEGVSFAYRPQQAILQDVSFHADSGEMVALVGPSGAGKSTVITLLGRFYEPSVGRVLIDGKDIREFNVQSLRRQIGIVMQENILFSGSIAENIKYGRQDATDEDVIKAAETANAHDFVRKLKHGYNSIVGERGTQLSGGQRQRIAIARVILKDPRILILDEATSALDSHSERLIQEAMERLMLNRTSIVIAHRLSTVVNASRILVMQAGRIVETGRHSELIEHNGLYRELHDLQFGPRPVSA